MSGRGVKVSFLNLKSRLLAICFSFFTTGSCLSYEVSFVIRAYCSFLLLVNFDCTQISKIIVAFLVIWTITLMCITFD